MGREVLVVPTHTTPDRRAAMERVAAGFRKRGILVSVASSEPHVTTQFENREAERVIVTLPRGDKRASYAKFSAQVDAELGLDASPPAPLVPQHLRGR